MRNPDRIPIILARLQEIWIAHPDLRLGQLLSISGLDLWSAEDLQLLNKLEERYSLNQTTINNYWTGKNPWEEIIKSPTLS